MKPIRLILLSILFLVLCAAHKAVGAEDALPADAQKLVAKCDEDVLKARRVLIAGLAKSMEKATKSGSLDMANAIRAKMDETMRLTGDDAPLLGGDAPAGTAPKHTAKVVTFYSLPGFKGSPIIAKTVDAITDCTAVGLANDSLRSVKVPAGFTVTLFESENGGGASRVITEDTENVGNVGGSGASSFIIQRAK